MPTPLQTATPHPHAAHFAAASPAVRQRLQAIQAEVLRQVPGAQACFSYRMPAFRLGAAPQAAARAGSKAKTTAGPVFFYFAAFKQHIGVYPPVHQDAALIRALAAHRGPKGNLSFAHDQPLPLALIGRVALALAQQYSPAAK